ncbi:hypothetical protein MMC13_007804 [Lambiella insularis]|nr:hypothetical protein [Lambiella insularis]
MTPVGPTSHNVSFSNKLIDHESTSQDSNNYMPLWQSFLQGHPALSALCRPSGASHKVFVDVPGRGEKPEGTTSWRNLHIATAITSLVHQLVLHFGSIPDIAILTAYRSQTFMLQEMLQEQDPDYFDIPVCTVDSYQGHEANIIILDFTTAEGGQDEHVGFVEDARRFNVVSTRAKKAMIVVKKPGLGGRSSHNMAAFIKDLEKRKDVAPMQISVIDSADLAGSAVDLQSVHAAIFKSRQASADLSQLSASADPSQLSPSVDPSHDSQTSEASHTLQKRKNSAVKLFPTPVEADLRQVVDFKVRKEVL